MSVHNCLSWIHLKGASQPTTGMVWLSWQVKCGIHSALDWYWFKYIHVGLVNCGFPSFRRGTYSCFLPYGAQMHTSELKTTCMCTGIDSVRLPRSVHIFPLAPPEVSLTLSFKLPFEADRSLTFPPVSLSGQFVTKTSYDGLTTMKLTEHIWCPGAWRFLYCGL